MNLAAIDIGSNALRLMFANVYENEEHEVQLLRTSFIRIPIRLGEDVFSQGHISAEREKKLIQTLRAFRYLIEAGDVDAYDACATAAMREADNGQEIVSRIQEQAGVNVRMIDGMEEAQTIRFAGKSDYSGQGLTMFIDVGGGSTEISLTRGADFLNAHSFNIGTLRILNQKVPQGEWERLTEWLQQYEDDFGHIECVGSGGNINKATKLFGDRMKKTISSKQLNKAFKDLSELSFEDRMKQFSLREDRADVIVPACAIFQHILKTIKAKQITVPKFGLVDGLIVQLYRKKND